MPDSGKVSRWSLNYTYNSRETSGFIMKKERYETGFLIVMKPTLRYLCSGTIA